MNSHVPMGEGYPPHQQGVHTVGPTCSSGCVQYGNRTEARTAQYQRKLATYMRTPTRKRRAARKQQRQNRKG